MSQFMSVTSPGMQRAASDFQAALSSSRSTLSSVQNEIATLGVAWTGNAATRFGQSLNSWCSEYQNICTQLDRILDALQTSAQTYAQNEAAAEQHAAIDGLTGL